METVECTFGTIVRFHSLDASFWDDMDEHGPDFTKENYASDIYLESEVPLAMILGADFTGVYVRVLWGERIGWVLNSGRTLEAL